jgi:DTW domain-containing protein YfiP
MNQKNENLLKKDPRAHQRINKHQACPDCFRSKETCICGRITPLSTKLQVILLQHPQEQFKVLNSAHLAHLILKNSKIRVGLSWPSFKTVAGESEQPSQWGILYLKGNSSGGKPCQVFNRQKTSLDDTSFLKGIIALDGSWKQAKALWWRNPWFLKLNRITLNPEHSSLRGQTKQEGLSTIEAIALALQCLGEDKTVSTTLREQYESLIIKPSLNQSNKIEQHDTEATDAP